MARYAAAHQNRTGPGDDRPTALQVVEDEGLTGGLRDKVVLITGCSKGGIGLQTARGLHATGCRLFITVRDPAKDDGIIAHVVGSDSGGENRVTVLPLQLDSLQSVRECAAEFLRQSKQLHVLILNAGAQRIQTHSVKLSVS